MEKYIVFQEYGFTFITDNLDKAYALSSKIGETTIIRQSDLKTYCHIREEWLDVATWDVE